MSRIFISYRRDDSADASGRLYDRLVAQFGKESVFKDVDTIPLGMDFRGVLREAVGHCDVMLAVIGRQWLTVKDEHGRRRLDNPADFVRIEVEAALERNIPVIPVLVQSASMPAESDLPPSLAQLAYRNGIGVRADPHFHGDVTLLIGRMVQLLQLTASADELLVQGRALGAQGRYAEALSILELAAQRDPRNAPAWVNIGVMLSMLKRPLAEQLAAYDRALALDANNASAWNNKGAAFNELGRFQDALAACDRALAADSNSALAWFNKGAALNSLKRSAEAVTAFDRALALDRNYAAAWRSKGLALYSLSRYEEALAAVDHGMALDPNNATAVAASWVIKGAALNGLRRYSEALVAADRALALNPTLAMAWTSKANSLRALGNKREAEQAERRAKELVG